jgi:uncharacterized protein
MLTTRLIAFLVLGICSGFFGGIVGIGGGILIVPVLVMAFGFEQHLAQGTSIAALLPPVGLLAVYVYHRNGNVHVPAALMIAMGFFFGALGGAKVAALVHGPTLQKVFGVLLVVVGMRFVFKG